MKSVLAAIIVSFYLGGSMFASEDAIEQKKRERLQALQEEYELEQQKIIFERLGYSKNIAIKTEVVSDEMLVQSIAGDPISVSQKLSGDSSYLVVRIANNGSSGIWGTLQCKIDGAGTVDINVPFLTPQKGRSRIFVVPLDGATLGDLDPKKIQVTCSWKELYAKP